ncbi:BlaI/MecI/CopY family transcriptional regulator [Taibaiella soli]|uniref:BlaI/MecI/CopY family transcriptional regulator n=1 Tax=Taibaiella soli TaxID=1649169 RepID=A0A2W2B3E6_9BACT|nr:BlaI/MecI/CopY family transcriptional regulator [Taibaiella soli]PZF70759.1 BlaI/MecI/CopY family transcriptional regulator [Taibaiella soli]
MKKLTKAEEQIMMVLWGMDGGLLMEIVERMPEPQPHKNTVATILKILVEKDFVKIEPVGRFHRYYANVSKDAYSGGTLNNVVADYFGGSFSDAVSFLVEKKKLSVKDLELLLKQIKKEGK